jgi:GNAT superfamily N-acetyltransferase
VHIRRAHGSEAPVLSALALEAKGHWGYSSEDFDRWRMQISVTDTDVELNPTFVAEIDHSIVGFYCLVKQPPTWELAHLWVVPQAMRRGIGRALLAHAVSTARDGGASAIAIDADPNAEPFYLACGAQRRGVVAAPVSGDPARVRPQLILSVLLPNPSIWTSPTAARWLSGR